MSDLTEAVDTIIKAKVAEALAGEGNTLIEKLVAAALSQEIEIGGTYNRKKVSFLDNEVTNGVERHVAKAINEILDENKERIKAAVRAKMEPALDHFSASIVDAFSSDDWRANLVVRVHRED